MIEEIAITLKKRGLTVSVAEACTAGRLAHIFTSIEGSSAYFIGGIIAYAESVKHNVLGIHSEFLAGYGSVSEVVAITMAQRIRELCNTTIGISVTGIAGPTGKTANKPIGLFYIGLSTKDYQACQRYIFNNSGRESNLAQASNGALQLLADYLLVDNTFSQ